MGRKSREWVLRDVIVVLITMAAMDEVLLDSRQLMRRRR
jgi:hypothetical protein